MVGYDKTKRKTVDGEIINYGLIYGNEKIIFIKVGAQSNIRGNKDKYLKIAQRLNRRLGATVICASNPYIDRGHIAADKDIIQKVADETGYRDFDIYFLGVSDGANHCLELAMELPKTLKVLGISASRKTKEDFLQKLHSLKNVKITLVYGTKDYENDILPFIEKENYGNVELISVNNADHEFHNMTEEFISLADLL